MGNRKFCCKFLIPQTKHTTQLVHRTKGPRLCSQLPYHHVIPRSAKRDVGISW